MARPPLDPQDRLVTVAVRLERDYLLALDVVAAALAASSGQSVTRSAAIRAILATVLDPVLHQKDVGEEVRSASQEALELAQQGVAFAKAGRKRARKLGTTPIRDALERKAEREEVRDVPFEVVESKAPVVNARKRKRRSRGSRHREPG